MPSRSFTQVIKVFQTMPVPSALVCPLPPQAFAFEIDIRYIGIDINSTALVAVEPIVREEVRPQKETPKATQQVTVAPNWIGRRAMASTDYLQSRYRWALFFNY
jgi:hypothetical protein